LEEFSLDACCPAAIVAESELMVFVPKFPIDEINCCKAVLSLDVDVFPSLPPLGSTWLLCLRAALWASSDWLFGTLLWSLVSVAGDTTGSVLELVAVLPVGKLELTEDERFTLTATIEYLK
jgi:hypothetical protein